MGNRMLAGAVALVVLSAAGLTSAQKPTANNVQKQDFSAQANTSDNVGGAGTPLGATPQTMPSTISTENAALDKLPIGALQLPLSEQSRALIAATMKATPDSSGTGAFGDLDVTAFMPTDVPLLSFPADLVRQVPETGRYKFVRREGIVFIIDPPNLTIVGEIHL